MQKLLVMLVVVIATFFVTLGGMWVYAAAELERSAITMEQIVARAIFGAMLSAWAMILYWLLFRRNRPAVTATSKPAANGQIAAY